MATELKRASVKSVSPSIPVAAGGLVRSMTGYGRAVGEDPRGRVTAEIRSVNGRFLKLSVKMPGRYGALEERVKQLIGDEGIKRGSVDVGLFFEGVNAEEGAYGINETAVRNYVKQARAIAKKLKLKGDVPLQALLPLPEVIKRQEQREDLEDIWARMKRVLAAATHDFNKMREREGAAMVADVRNQLAQLALHHSMIRDSAPETLKDAVNRFKERITKLLEQMKVNADVNKDMLEREIVLATDRTDISEEIARLLSHFEQMEGTLAQGGEVGKKLDFLTQELFRETNTIGSKTGDERVTYRVVEMKGIIERIREQVQNLE